MSILIDQIFYLKQFYKPKKRKEFQSFDYLFVDILNNISDAIFQLKNLSPLTLVAIESLCGVPGENHTKTFISRFCILENKFHIGIEFYIEFR